MLITSASLGIWCDTRFTKSVRPGFAAPNDWAVTDTFILMYVKIILEN
jgi:hypothetical protein